MPSVIRTRTVGVDDETFLVPTNVCWSEALRTWVFAVTRDREHMREVFPPHRYDNSLRKAFEAAVKFADEHRGGYHRQQRQRRRSIRNYPVLPEGVYLIPNSSKFKPLLKMVVYTQGHPSKTFTLGHPEFFTRETYDNVLNQALDHRRKLLNVDRKREDAKPEDLSLIQDKLAKYDESKAALHASLR